MGNCIYGYVRILKNEQDESLQVSAIRDYGVDESRIFIDRVTTENTISSAYWELIGKIQPGDSIVIKSISLLGITYEDIIYEWIKITKEHGSAIIVLDMSLPELTNALNPQFVSEFALDVMCYIVKSRKEIYLQKQSAGITAAHQRGVKFGRPTKKDSKEFRRLEQAFINKEITADEAAKELNISRGTFYRWIREDSLNEGMKKNR